MMEVPPPCSCGCAAAVYSRCLFYHLSATVQPPVFSLGPPLLPLHNNGLEWSSCVRCEMVCVQSKSFRVLLLLLSLLLVVDYVIFKVTVHTRTIHTSSEYVKECGTADEKIGKNDNQRAELSELSRKRSFASCRPPTNINIVVLYYTAVLVYCCNTTCSRSVWTYRMVREVRRSFQASCCNHGMKKCRYYLLLLLCCVRRYRFLIFC